MKIGNMEFKEYAARKPVTVSSTGAFLTACEIANQPTLGSGSLFTLDADSQLKLALERYSLEPDFRLGIIGAGLFTKGEIIEHLKRQTDLGRMILRAEMGYLNELIAQLPGGIVPDQPSIPERPLSPFPDWRWRKRCIWLRLTNRVLFCEDTTDPLTTPFANYRIANVHPVFQARGFTLTVLQGADNVRANFAPQAKNVLTVYLGGTGHGYYDHYRGHQDDRILEVGHYDPAEVNDKAIHFLSCKTARDLGPNAVASGAECYTGYSEPFIFVWDDGTTPAVNEFELFARSDSTFDIEMANGATAQEAYDATYQTFNAAMAQVPNTVAAIFLRQDRDRLTLRGDGMTTIEPHRAVKICFPITRLEEEDALVKAGELAD